MWLNCIPLAETFWTALFQNYIETIMEKQPTCTILYYLHHLTGFWSWIYKWKARKLSKRLGFQEDLRTIVQI